MTDFRCFKCRNLLLRGLLIVARVEVKCSKCNAVNLWQIGDVAGCPLDTSSPTMVAV